MRALKQESTSPKLVGEVHFARIRLAKAESRLATAKEQARLARRRRKEAKLVARRAKKHARLAKKEVAEAKLVLAQAEDKLARLKQRPFRIKPRKKLAKKVAAAPRGKKPARTVAIRQRTSVKQTKPLAKPTKSRPRVSLKKKVVMRPVTVLRDLETSDVIASTPAAKPTDEFTHSGAAIVPTSLPPEEHSATPNQTVT